MHWQTLHIFKTNCCLASTPCHRHSSFPPFYPTFLLLSALLISSFFSSTLASLFSVVFYSFPFRFPSAVTSATLQRLGLDVASSFFFHFTPFIRFPCLINKPSVAFLPLCFVRDFSVLFFLFVCLLSLLFYAHFLFNLCLSTKENDRNGVATQKDVSKTPTIAPVRFYLMESDWF